MRVNGQGWGLSHLVEICRDRELFGHGWCGQKHQVVYAEANVTESESDRACGYSKENLVPAAWRKEGRVVVGVGCGRVQLVWQAEVASLRVWFGDLRISNLDGRVPPKLRYERTMGG